MRNGTDIAERQRAIQAQVAKAFGGIDVLVNNAAFQLHVSRFEDLTEAHFDLTVKTNLYGYFHMAQACVPHMKEGSAIVNSGSVTGLMGNSTIIDYSMTKGGIHALIRALSGSLLARGIRVNAVASGPAGGDRARLCLPRLGPDVELHHWRDSAGDRKLFRPLILRGGVRAPSRAYPHRREMRICRRPSLWCGRGRWSRCGCSTSPMKST